jgi:DNA-binding beta-propeller fold protein YncE
VNSRLFVADYSPNRVMVFNVAPGSIANGENAIAELGHASGGTAYTATASGVTAVKMNTPTGVAYNSANTRLFVADQANNRVMVFSVPSGFTNGPSATNIIGQTNTTNHGAATTQSGMNTPGLISYDANAARLFVADTFNERVLVYNVAPGVIATGENASNVIGQANFTSNGAGLTQSGLELDDVFNNSIACAKYDPATTHLFVCDTDYNRVMIFDGTAMPPVEYFNP